MQSRLLCIVAMSLIRFAIMPARPRGVHDCVGSVHIDVCDDIVASALADLDITSRCSACRPRSGSLVALGHKPGAAIPRALTGLGATLSRVVHSISDQEGLFINRIQPSQASVPLAQGLSETRSIIHFRGPLGVSGTPGTRGPLK